MAGEHADQDRAAVDRAGGDRHDPDRDLADRVSRPGWYGRRAPPADRLALIRLAAGTGDRGFLIAGEPVPRSPAVVAIGSLVAVAVAGALWWWMRHL
jgi:hypothetical protein